MIVSALIAAVTVTSISAVLGKPAGSVIRTFVFSILITYASLLDIKSREVDDIFSACILCFSFSFRTLGDIPKIAVGAVFGLLIMLIPALIMKKGKLGGADIKMSCAVGAFLTSFNCAIAIIFSMILSLIYGIKHKDKSIPLIPFIAVGAVITNLILE